MRSAVPAGDLAIHSVCNKPRTSHRWGSCKWVVQSKNQVHVAMTLDQSIHAVIVISDTGCRRAAFGRLFSKKYTAGFRPLQTERILNDFEIMSKFTRPIHLVMSLQCIPLPGPITPTQYLTMAESHISSRTVDHSQERFGGKIGVRHTSS